MPPAANPVREAFEAWEKPTAEFWEAALSSPLVLRGLHQTLTWTLGWQRANQRALEAAWRFWGLPTRGDQELARHRVNELTADVQRLAAAIDDLSQR
jgi:hypothetical protein